MAIPVIDLQRTGVNIEKLRKNAGLSVRDIQRVMGFETPQAIYKWQQGVCLPTIDNLLILSKMFNVTMEQILIFEEVMEVSVA